MQGRAHKAPAAGDAGDETAETMSSSQGGAVYASSASRGRAETTETMGSSEGGTVDASPVPEGRAVSYPGAASTSETSQRNGGGPPAGLSGRPAHEPAAKNAPPLQYGDGPGAGQTPGG